MDNTLILEPGLILFQHIPPSVKFALWLPLGSYTVTASWDGLQCVVDVPQRLCAIQTWEKVPTKYFKFLFVIPKSLALNVFLARISLRSPNSLAPYHFRKSGVVCGAKTHTGATPKSRKKKVPNAWNVALDRVNQFAIFTSLNFAGEWLVTPLWVTSRLSYKGLPGSQNKNKTFRSPLSLCSTETAQMPSLHDSFAPCPHPRLCFVRPLHQDASRPHQIKAKELVLWDINKAPLGQNSWKLSLSPSFRIRSCDHRHELLKAEGVRTSTEAVHQ